MHEALLGHLKAHNSMYQGCCSIFLQLLYDQIFRGLLFYEFVGIHQVRIVVYDNYL